MLTISVCLLSLWTKFWTSAQNDLCHFWHKNT